MRIVITGGGGFVGRRLGLRLLERNRLEGSRAGAVDEVVLFDQAPPAGLPNDPRLVAITGDLTDRATVGRVIGPGTDLVFHLAAVVSAGAEEDFDLGMNVNLEGTRHVLDACRELGSCPRIVFASSVAAYGGEVPDVLDDLTILTPQTSYGTQKAIGELLINDYSRKGIVDGRALRLPTVVVRPGKPNRAASTFASSIIREPLQGESVVCPVGQEQGMYLSSPRRIVDAFMRAAELPAEAWGTSRALLLPGITITVGDMVAALRRVAGDHVAGRIRWEPDPAIQKIVSGWPTRFEARRARAMGFDCDSRMDEIIMGFVEDELGGSFAR